MWSLSPHLRADHMGNSMKIRMRFIQNHKVIFDYLFKSSYMPV